MSECSSNVLCAIIAAPERRRECARRVAPGPTTTLLSENSPQLFVGALGYALSKCNVK